jgi:hypothetical protein
MASLADPRIAEAVRLQYESAKEARALAQDALDLADKNLTVASALHDLLVEELSAARLRRLRSVS